MALWREIEDWRYEVFGLDTDAETFGRHADLVRRWRAKAPDGGIPDRSDFAFEDFTGWWGWITITQLLDPEGRALRYRLWGSYVAELTRLEMTGKTMQDHHGRRPDGTNYNDTDLAFVRELVARCAIGRNSGPVDWDMPEYRQMSTIRLPIRFGGDRIGGFLSGVRAY